MTRPLQWLNTKTNNMLTILSTNFGVAPADIQIELLQSGDMIMLDGEFSVDTTAAEYAGIRPMQITTGPLAFEKSRVSTALVTAESGGVKYCTLAKVWLTGRNTINIAKIIPYKSLGTYKVRLSTLLIPQKITGAVATQTMKTYTPSVIKGAGTDIEVYTVENYLWMMLVFKASTLAFDAEDEEVQISIPNFPTWASGEFPIIYNESLWSNLGSKYYPASLQNGVLTIRKGGQADEASGTGKKFVRVFLVHQLNTSEEGWTE